MVLFQQTYNYSKQLNILTFIIFLTEKLGLNNYNINNIYIILCMYSNIKNYNDEQVG
jgi:hypothetical protein